MLTFDKNWFNFYEKYKINSLNLFYPRSPLKYFGINDITNFKITIGVAYPRPCQHQKTTFRDSLDNTRTVIFLKSQYEDGFQTLSRVHTPLLLLVMLTGEKTVVQWWDFCGGTQLSLTLQLEIGICIRNLTRLAGDFEELLQFLREMIHNLGSRLRETIPAHLRLAIILCFLESRESFTSLVSLLLYRNAESFC